MATQFVNLNFAGYSVDAKRWPKLTAYLGKVHARPSFRAVIDKENRRLRGLSAGRAEDYTLSSIDHSASSVSRPASITTAALPLRST